MNAERNGESAARNARISNTADPTLYATTAHAAPTNPKPGSGPTPKINSGEMAKRDDTAHCAHKCRIRRAAATTQATRSGLENPDRNRTEEKHVGEANGFIKGHAESRPRAAKMVRPKASIVTVNTTPNKCCAMDKLHGSG